MAEYTYSREWTSTDYKIENIERVDGEDDHIYLATEIDSALPGKTFKLFGDENTLRCVFDIALSAPEKTTLDSVVAAHIANT
jgi:hypothetical protein